jgi:outer membrane receptor protein involved in Fe transport
VERNIAARPTPAWPLSMLVLILLLLPVAAAAQTQPSTTGTTATGALRGLVRDASGSPLPGAIVGLNTDGGTIDSAVTDEKGAFEFPSVHTGRYTVRVALINFTGAVRNVNVEAGAAAMVDAVLHLSLDADVTVTGKESFVNLADVERPEDSLIGVASSSSQGAVTARQIEQRPIMRAGEVLETVPGLIISQHSGEGKANQYYLRGFNLDHGTDFATTVAGVPVNMPTHAHGHGYSDLNFLIPELISGVQYQKGPYFADQSDFSSAGAASINYANALDAPIARLSAGGQGWGRLLHAASPRVGRGNLLYALELNRNDGPWTRGDDYRRVNGVLRYSEGDARNGLSITAMGYRGTWDSSDQIPSRAIGSNPFDFGDANAALDGSSVDGANGASGSGAGRAIGRFDTLDLSSGGETYRYSLSADLQRTTTRGTTKFSVFGAAYGLDLFSNFTFFLDDPVNGDQFEQEDERMLFGGRVSHRWFDRWAGRTVENTIGAQLRHDAIGTVGLYRTRARQRLSTVREDAIGQTSGAIYAQNQIQWTSTLRTQIGLRGDLYRFDVNSRQEPLNSGTDVAGLVSPKAGVVVGPFRGTEFYANAGYGYHSNDARGATITRDPNSGEPVDRVTPLARARGAEVGVRTVAIPHLQTTFTLWTLGLDSELLFVGDAGTTEASRPSRRTGVEWTNYYRPMRWLTFDADLSWSRARFTDDATEGARIPGAVETVASLGVTVEPTHRLFGSVRLRYFGPRPLIEDDSVRSEATRLVNAQAGYQVRRGLRVAVDVFNLTNTRASDIDYFYTSRLPGEPDGGVDDVHFHPALPRTARVSLIVDF